MDAPSVSQDHARAEDQPKPQEPIATHRGGGSWSLLLFIAPVIYVLSIGPVAKVALALHLDKSRAVEHTLEIIYFPVLWSAEHSQPFQRALDWYLYRVWKLPS